MSDEKTPIWHKLPNETDVAFASFRGYRDQLETHKRRSLRRHAADTDRAISTIEDWSSKYNWVERAAAYDAYCDSEYLKNRDSIALEMQKMHAKGARELYEKAMHDLMRRDWSKEKMENITSVLKAAAALEAKALGEPDRKVNVQADVAISGVSAFAQKVMEMDARRRAENQSSDPETTE
jgi:hypothetical protein